MSYHSQSSWGSQQGLLLHGLAQLTCADAGAGCTAQLPLSSQHSSASSLAQEAFQDTATLLTEGASVMLEQLLQVPGLSSSRNSAYSCSSESEGAKGLQPTAFAQQPNEPQSWPGRAPCSLAATLAATSLSSAQH